MCAFGEYFAPPPVDDLLIGIPGEDGRYTDSGLVARTTPPPDGALFGPKPGQEFGTVLGIAGRGDDVDY